MKKIFHFCLLIFASLVISFGTLNGQVTYDNNVVTKTPSNGNSSAIANFTVPAGNDRLLVVTSGSFDHEISSITYDGQSFSLGAAKIAAFLNSEIWYLPLGSGDAITSNISISYTGNNATLKTLGAASYHNVDQSNPIGDSQTSTCTPCSSRSATIVSTAGDMVIDAVYKSNNNGVYSPGSSQTQLFDISNGNNGNGAASYVSASGNSVDLSWTFGANATSSYAALSLNQCSVCAAALIPTMGEWTLIIFGLIVLSLGVIYVMRWHSIYKPVLSTNA